MSGPALLPLDGGKYDPNAATAAKVEASQATPRMELQPYKIQPTSGVPLRSRVAGVNTVNDLGAPSTKVQDKRAQGKAGFLFDRWKLGMGLDL